MPKKTPRQPARASSVEDAGATPSADISVVTGLTRLMNANDLVELEYATPALTIKLRKQGHAAPIYAAPAPSPVASAAQIPVAAPAASAPVAVSDEFANCTKVISPIPGTVYLKANPDAPLFVQVGTQIDDTKVLCLVEAMKVFNEIKAEAGTKGTIRKVCVNDGQPVEYGTVLFLVG